MTRKILAACFTFLFLHIGSAFAAGTFIPAPNRVDMVHDGVRNTIYITDGGNVLRYHVPTASFLAPIALGGQLNGIDLSPDGSTLAVADRTVTATEQWVFLVRLSDLAVTRVPVLKESMEDGMWAVAYANDGSLFVTARFAGSGWVPLRRLNPVTLTWTRLGTAYPNNIFRQNTMVSASGDGKTIAFAEANTSDGAWGTFHLPTGQLARREGYTNGTSWFNFEIAADATGSQYAIPTYGGTFVYNSSYAKIGTIGTYAGAQPIGVAYHPVEPLIYFPWATTGEVRVFNATSLSQTGSYDFEDSFQHTGNGAYRQGRTRLSRDGSLLMVSVTGGVRFLQMYAPLSAAAVTGTTRSPNPVTMGLKGAIGNAGAISYAISAIPANGTAYLNGGFVTYTPAAGFVGIDTFKYVAKYGGATAESTISVTVTAPNNAPVARNDAAQTPRNTTVTIPVLANDTDADGDALVITMVTGAQGSAAIQGGNIVFTPVRNFFGSTSFGYSISDGKGGSASATVTVNVTKK